MKKKPSIYKRASDEKPSSKRKIRLTTGKMILLVLVLIAAAGIWAIGETREKNELQQEQAQVRKNTYQYVYTNSTYIGDFQNRILIYDGHNLRLVNEAGNEELNVILTAENFSVDTNGKNIYLTDIAKRTTFIIDETGKVINQAISTYLPKRVVAMPDGKFVIHYITDTLVEGVGIYSNDGQLMSEYTYPKVTLTLIKPSISKGVIVVGLYRDASKLTNLVYEYSLKGELKHTNQIDNLLLTNMDIQGKSYIWQDINQIYITDNDFKNIAKIDSNNPYEGIVVTEDMIYTLDDDNAISIIDDKYTIIKESRFSEDIEGIAMFKGEPLYYSENRTFYKNNIKELTKSIVDVIGLKNTIVLVSKGELKFERK